MAPFAQIAAAAPPAGLRYAGDFPDPNVVVDGLDWYAYSTNVFPSGGGVINVPVMHSTDAESWTLQGDAMPNLASWVSPNMTWAPGVVRIGSTWHLYYTANEAASGMQCLGHATASSPSGPFTDSATGPFLCQRDRGGSIDAAPYVAPDGSRYLVWKSDDNAIGQPTSLWSMRLGSQGGAASAPTQLLTSSGPWQGGVMEGPAMIDSGGNTVLFYGGSFWNSSSYAIGVASCATPLGPCSDATVQNPWLSSANGPIGPGGPSVTIGPAGRPVMAFDAWYPGVGYPANNRALYVEPFDFTALGPYLRPDLPPMQHDPFGSLDSVGAGPGSISLGGWSIDPDSASSDSVHVYVDGGFATSLTANGARPDVAAYFPAYGTPHGYLTTLTGVAPGTHQVCTYGIDIGRGSNGVLGCHQVTVPSGPPFGSLDAAYNGPGSVTAGGWTIDPDTASSIAVHVYVDGSFRAATSAAASRPDVGAACPAYGDAHGYNVPVSGLAPGTHSVCTYGINVGAGSNSGLGCRFATVMSGSPFGSLDVANGGSGKVSVAGWAIDWDTTSPIDVHVYVDGQGFVVGAASSSRPDVGAFFPGYGATHGFNAVLSGIPAGTHNVCAYGIDVGPGANNAVGCAVTTVT